MVQTLPQYTRGLVAMIRTLLPRVYYILTKESIVNVVDYDDLNDSTYSTITRSDELLGFAIIKWFPG